MIGSLWLASSFVCRANAFLNGVEDAALENLPGLEYVKQLRFKIAEEPGFVADSPTKWFKYLRAEGFERATIYFDRYENGNTDLGLLGFAGAMKAAPFTEGRDKAVVWYGSENVLDLKDPDRKIWEVGFEGHTVTDLPPGVIATISEARIALQLSLDHLVEFCAEQSLTDWGFSFDHALRRFDDPVPGFDGAGRVFPSRGYTDGARALFFAAADSWVFGGMGSWNDMGFSDDQVQNKYDELSVELYKAILKSLYASTASFDLS